ncbi:photo-regulated tyrosinase [Amylocystis lapponica]|nr:photo-regulated tyrosinase [Amylocystis lapponica]
MSHHFVITGAHGGHTQGAQAPNRREIHDFVKDEKQFSLYIQAFAAMSDVSQKDLISFFQIGGIHGLPNVEWNGSGSDKSASTEWGGYCTHGSVLFPTWHRAYMALFEQVLQHHAINVAKQYTVDADAWNLAAINLRAPYWDWASHVLPPPEVISYEKVAIITPASEGQKVFVENPIFSYRFHPIDPSFSGPTSLWVETLRHPTNPDADAKSNVKQLEQTLDSASAGIRKSLYNLMTRVNTWEAFSNHTPGDGGSATASLEGIHDGIHNDVGGFSSSGNTSYRGHMSDPAVAGFDPIFFLHHSNVDRMLSLWAAIHPTVWVDKGPANEGTWTIATTASVDETTELTPFWSSQKGYWNSTQLTQTSPLGYTYPEFNDLDMGDTDAVRLAISHKVNALYGSGAPPPTPGPEPPLSVLEWTAEVHFKKFELHQSFTVLLFLGHVPEDPAAWRTSAAFVGAVHAFVNSAAEHCANCRRNADVQVEGFVHLNDALLKHPQLRSLAPDVVVPFLQRSLAWRVYTVRGGNEVPVENLKSLEITVVAAPVTQGPGDVFPVAGTPERFPNVTRGRQGGHGSPTAAA